jgi:hemin uptake protein HemP
MTTDLPRRDAAHEQDIRALEVPADTAVRLQSRDLFRHGREVEIAHDGRIYRLRLTQLNKLILTA